MLNQKNKNILMLIINAFIVISTIIITILGVINGAGDGQLGDLIGVTYFMAFTVDSNILSALACFILLLGNIKQLKNSDYRFPICLSKFQYIAAIAVCLTLMTVIILLAPMQVLQGNSYFRLFKDDMFFFHLINPLLAILETIFLNNNYVLNNKDNFYACLPTIIYSVVYTTMVLSNKWPDFYNFTFGGQIIMVPIMLTFMNIATFLFGFIIRKIHNKLMEYE